MNDLVSVVIPARNEQYLSKTIDGLLTNSSGNIEIIAVLDGYWPKYEELSFDKRVNYIHFTDARGMRNGINKAVDLANGRYILKTDAHCLWAKGYDQVLKESHQENWVVVPRRYSLDKETWTNKNKPPVDYMYLSKDLHGREWTDKNAITETLPKIDDLMSSQGSAWFMTKDYYNSLDLLDESKYGSFWQEFQEIGLKCWLSGGEVKINKNTWYSHLHKDKIMGRGYRLGGDEQDNAAKEMNKWLTEKVFSKQIHDINWLIEKFKPVPTWN